MASGFCFFLQRFRLFFFLLAIREDGPWPQDCERSPGPRKFVSFPAARRARAGPAQPRATVHGYASRIEPPRATSFLPSYTTQPRLVFGFSSLPPVRSRRRGKQLAPSPRSHPSPGPCSPHPPSPPPQLRRHHAGVAGIRPGVRSTPRSLRW
jgi:hypothetical protein